MARIRNPAAAGQAPDPLGIGAQDLEHGLHRRYLCRNRKIDDAFDPGAQLLG